MESKIIPLSLTRTLTLGVTIPLSGAGLGPDDIKGLAALGQLLPNTLPADKPFIEDYKHLYRLIVTICFAGHPSGLPQLSLALKALVLEIAPYHEKNLKLDNHTLSHGIEDYIILTVTGALKGKSTFKKTQELAECLLKAITNDILATKNYDDQYLAQQLRRIMMRSFRSPIVSKSLDELFTIVCRLAKHMQINVESHKLSQLAAQQSAPTTHSHGSIVHTH